MSLYALIEILIISIVFKLGPTYTDLTTQLNHHEQLQKDLEAEQENINSLSNMVVVVDENGSDSGKPEFVLI